MESNEGNVTALAGFLQQTLSPDPAIRRPAEQILEKIECNQNYPLILLQLVDKTDCDVMIRVAGSITLKNYVRRNWPLEEDGPDRIHPADREGVRNAIVGVMLRAPMNVQKQLSDAVSAIGKHDFPDKWPNLIPEMVEKFSTGDFHLINGVLQTAHSLFKRYRFEFKSEKLWQEIKFVLERFAKPLTDLFLATLELSKAHDGNAAALQVIYSSLLLICKVFHSLNYQDLPEFFEDNMPVWMPNLLNLLQAKVPCLETTDPSEAGVVERVRAEAVECAALYALKYGEEFAPHAPSFVTAAWGTLVDAGPQPKYDQLVSGALCFLGNVAEKNHYRSLFEDPATLSSICEKVVIPNMEFRESDQELFEDNPEEYMRRDLEGSDVETRRRAACDLVKVLSVNFEEKIFQIFGQYVQVMLARHAASPDGSQWRSKDAALFLVTSLSERGRTQRAGVTSASTLVNLNQFCSDNVMPDLAAANVNATPVLKADAIKYIMTFRTLLPKSQILSAIPCLVQLLNAESAVVASYAASCIERLVMVIGRDPQLSQSAPAVLRGLKNLMQRPEHLENDYAMKAVMRTLAVLQDSCVEALGELLPHLAQTLAAVTKNPSRPHFNHYLFESLSLCIKMVCKSNPGAVDSFEDALFPIFQEILQQEVIEFMPYVFQMLSLLVEQRIATGNNSGDVGGPYITLVGCLLAPPLWERTANVRPLVRLLCALTTSSHASLLKDNRLNGMLGVFQKLIASKANDQEGFVLIQCMLQNFPREAMQPFLKQIVSLVFQRLTSSKTTKFLRGLIPFLAFYAIQYGPDELVNTLESVQPGLFGLYVERVLITELQKVTGPASIKIAAVGYTRLLCETTSLFQPEQKYTPLWIPVFKALISFLELPTDDTNLPEDHWVDVEEPLEYQAAYCQLSSAKQIVADPLPKIGETRQYLVESMANLGRTSPAQLSQLLSLVPSDHKVMLEAYQQRYQTRII